MIKAVLFDFDGTLINTNELIFNSYKEAFKKVLKRDIFQEEILTLYGRPLYASFEKYGDAQDELYRVYREFNESRHDDLAKPFDGAVCGVDNIIAKGYKVGIVTSKRIALVERGINIMGLNGRFDVIITPDDTKKAKPDPEPVLCGCKRLGVLPSETIYVGDSEFDMCSGRSAGTQICAVNYTITPIERLMEFNPEYFVDSIDELSGKLEDIR